MFQDSRCSLYTQSFKYINGGTKEHVFIQVYDESDIVVGYEMAWYHSAYVLHVIVYIFCDSNDNNKRAIPIVLVASSLLGLRNMIGTFFETSLVVIALLGHGFLSYEYEEWLSSKS